MEHGRVLKICEIAAEKLKCVGVLAYIRSADYIDVVVTECADNSLPLIYYDSF